MSKKDMILGWEEWCALPDLNIPAIKAKVDTGARTSSLHAFDIKHFQKDGQKYVQFEIHPIQKSKRIKRICTAPLVDKRHVKNSGGRKERRPVIKTTLKIGGHKWEIEITLTNRDSMGFRMLLGRQAMRERIIVDPGATFCQRRVSPKKLKELYNNRKI